MELLKQSLAENARLLKSRVSKQAIFGLIAAAILLLAANIFVCYAAEGAITLDGLIAAQKANKALWILDTFPFLFMFWGQYISAVIAYEASAMVVDQTSELRMQTSALEAQVTHEMTHDALTGLPNRVLFLDRLNQALTSGRHETEQLALMMIDLSNFKEMINSLGHYNGDRLLKQFAVRLESAIQQPNTMARLGNEQFALLAPKVSDANAAIEIVRKIQQALKTPFVLEDLALNIQARIGIAIFPEHGADADTLLQRADVAVDAAIQEQADFVVYSSKLDKHSQRRLILMNELRQAIENDVLTIYYQPKVDIKTGDISVEAMYRWPHPQYGMIMPEDFLPLAERTGLMKSLSTWGFNKVLQHCGNWRQRGIALDVSINLTSIEVMDVELPDKLAGELACYGVKSEWLILEITESSIMKNQELALQIVTRLVESGVRIAIDHFGTGYSSLAYLSKLPASELKIDKSFVLNMTSSKNDAMIVNATIDLAHNLGLKVVADGVEDKDTLALLKKLGCDAIQGYFISPPLSLVELDHWLNTSLWAGSKQTNNYDQNSQSAG